MFPIEYSPLVALAFLLALAAVVGLVRYVFQALSKDFLGQYERNELKRKPQYLFCLRDRDSLDRPVKGLRKGSLYRLVAKQPDDEVRIELEPGRHLICPATWLEPVRLSSDATGVLEELGIQAQVTLAPPGG